MEITLEDMLNKVNAITRQRQVNSTPRNARKAGKRATLHSDVKLVRKLSKDEIRELNKQATPIINCNAGRYHNNQSTISEKAQTHTLQPNPACWITLREVVRLAKLCKTEEELRQQITDYYQLERKNQDAMLSQREFDAMVKAFDAGRDRYYTLHKQ